MDVREQGMALLWQRVKWYHNRKKHRLLKDAMDVWVAQVKASEAAKEESE